MEIRIELVQQEDSTSAQNGVYLTIVQFRNSSTANVKYFQQSCIEFESC